MLGMFGNFIYFIVVLLIYSTYQPSEETNFSGIETLFLFITLILFFAWITRIQFRRLEKRLSKESFHQLGHKFSATLTRQSIMAIVLFSVDIYGLNLTSFLINIPYLSIIPTFQALLFLGLFVFYLAIVWACAYGPYRMFNTTDLSRRAYILGNISFSIPVLIPWVLLSGIADIINAMPFELPKRFLSTTEGQMAYFLVFLFAIAIVGPAMIQKFWRCKPLETGYYRRRIENLCQKAGMEYANILYWPIFGGRMITAGVMGLIKKFRYILVTGALLQFLEPEEIDAVIAHEIGHIKKKHLLFYLIFFVGYMLVSFATFDMLIYFIFFAEPIYSFLNSIGIEQATVTSSIFSLIIILIFLIYFRYIFGYFMRNFERQADTYVYALFDSAQPLISTLEKIAVTSGQPRDKPNWHHFSIKKRVDYLKKCEADRTWITRHDSKIKKSIAVYLMGILLMGGIGYNLNFGETGKKLNRHFFEKIIQRELDDNPQVLNNLAWLYATCEVERFRDPKMALKLAEKAAEIEKSPHILDTLAESFYVNSQFEKAVAAEMGALDLATKNRTHYENQLAKFKAAAKK
jgi:Zn-dependent protease with chaperone function